MKNEQRLRQKVIVGRFVLYYDLGLSFAKAGFLKAHRAGIDTSYNVSSRVVSSFSFFSKEKVETLYCLTNYIVTKYLLI